MNKDNLLIGLISVIGLLTLYNTYSILTAKTPLPIPPQQNNAANFAANNSNNYLDQQNNPNFPTPNNQLNPNQNPQIQQPQQPTKPSGPPTKIAFKKDVHDFGEVMQDSENNYVFEFTNTGTNPLIISDAKGSCGCTVPEYPKEPVMPGETGEIKVKYSPGKQQGDQTKTVTLTANTEPATTVLKIKANVKVDPNAPKQQPVQIQQGSGE